MAKRTKRTKGRARKAKSVKRKRAGRSAKRASTTVKAGNAFKQPFSALQNKVSSVMSYFK